MKMRYYPNIPHHKIKSIPWLLFFVLACLVTIYTWATWHFFTERVPGGNDLITHTKAWEAYFKYGYSPYSEEASLFTQMAIYGRPAQQGEDQNRMVYPFYSILLHGPFALIDFELARAIYMTLSQVALLVGVFMMLDVLRWRPHRWLLGLLAAWSLLFYPQARGLILGQFAIFGFFSLAAALFFLARQRDFLAGAWLTISTIKPTLVFLVIPFMLLWGLSRRRWRFVGGFMGVLTLLMLGSFLVLPTWFSEWLFRVGLYSGYTVGQSPVWLFTHLYYPALGSAGEIALSLLLAAGMLMSWWLAFRPGGLPWFHYSLGITLVVSSLIVPRSATTNYVLMLVTLLWVFSALDRTPGWGRPVLLLTWLISFIGLWWLHFATVIGNQEQAIMFLPLPLALSIVLLVGYPWLMHHSGQQKLSSQVPD